MERTVSAGEVKLGSKASKHS